MNYEHQPATLLKDSYVVISGNKVGSIRLAFAYGGRCVAQRRRELARGTEPFRLECTDSTEDSGVKG